MKIIANWRQAWRWWSVRLSALGTIVCALLLAAPDAIASAWHLLPLDTLPGWVVRLLQLLLFAGVLVARFIQQREGAADDDA